MIGSEAQEVERKVITILQVLSDSHEPLGARVIAQRLKDHGVELGERAVRYHLKLMDERGLTQLVGRDGRLILEPRIEELKSALVRDKVGFAISRIELLAFRTDFDCDKRSGSVPVNVSFFAKEKFAVRAPFTAKQASDSDALPSSPCSDTSSSLRYPKVIITSIVISIATRITLLQVPGR